LVLGGVEIACERGLAGHSDADVLSHAIIDALLGAAADGDIGRHFPDTDPAWEDACSLDLLVAVAVRIAARPATVINVDATVMAQEPRLAPHIEAMRLKLAAAAGIDVEYMSVKATTTERMGAIGREEGIAALAVATIDDGAESTPAR